MYSSRAFFWLAPLAIVAAGGTFSAASTVCLPLLCPPLEPPRVSVVSALTTVRFDQPTPPGATAEATLAAARNEYESFQVVIEARSAINDLEVVAARPLGGPGAASISSENLTVYREVAYRVGGPGKPPSDAEGGAGLWPDALIPERDPLYGERRSAFPIDLQANGKAIAWVDVFVPAGQRPGAYRGSVIVRGAAGRLAEVPVALTVRGFRIPSTSSLANSFRINWRTVCRAHTGDPRCGGENRWPLFARYVRLALQNRVTLSNPIPLEDDMAPRRPAALRNFRRHILPLITGANRSLRLRGARLTAVSISWFCLEHRGCLRAWRRLAARHGFTGRFSLYLCDEPLEDPGRWRECTARARLADRQARGVPALVTATIAEARRHAGRGRRSLLQRINILVPIVNDIAGRHDTGVAGDQRPSYDGFLAAVGPRRRLWTYTSCRSHGCAGAPPDTTTPGWPGYAIDAPASQARALGWLAFEYRLSGELYYQTTEALDSAWDDQFRFGGNGDGTLFYPGNPSPVGAGPAIGGDHPIPIESIRLKRIRDGREDYEYLRILAARGRGAAAMRVVRGLFGPTDTAMHSATVSAADLERARTELAELIQR